MPSRPPMSTDPGVDPPDRRRGARGARGGAPRASRAHRDRAGDRRRRGPHPRRGARDRRGRARDRPGLAPADGHQPRAPAPLDPRRAAPDHRARRRGHPRPAPGDRLPAHRHREAVREQDLLAGHHARHADGLPGLLLQHPRLRDGGGAPAGARGPRPRPVPARGHVRAQPHHEPPGLARHQRPGARRHHAALLHLPRAREGPRPVRDDRRRPHEHAVLPGGRLRRRHAPGVRAAPAGLPRRDARPHRRVRGPAVEQPDLARPHQGHRRPPGRRS